MRRPGSGVPTPPQLPQFALCVFVQCFFFFFKYSSLCYTVNPCFYFILINQLIFKDEKKFFAKL